MRACFLKNAALVLVAWAASLSVLAHEFWIEANPPSPAVNAPVLMTLRVGELFTGEVVGITSSHAASLHALSAGKDEDLGAKVPTGSMLPALRLSFAQAGSHVLAYESHPSKVVLAADKFHAYLHDEGLDWVIRQREAAGTAGTPGRERFRRSAKALLKVGDAATAHRRPVPASASTSRRWRIRWRSQPAIRCASSCASKASRAPA